MYCSSPDPSAERTQIAGRMGGATQSTASPFCSITLRRTHPLRCLFWLEWHHTSSSMFHLKMSPKNILSSVWLAVRGPIRGPGNIFYSEKGMGIQIHTSVFLLEMSHFHHPLMFLVLKWNVVITVCTSTEPCTVHLSDAISPCNHALYCLTELILCDSQTFTSWDNAGRFLSQTSRRTM